MVQKGTKLSFEFTKSDSGHFLCRAENGIADALEKRILIKLFGKSINPFYPLLVVILFKMCRFELLSMLTRTVLYSAVIRFTLIKKFKIIKKF